MKVILKQTIAKVGKSGQVANVADGFARNFLFPRGLAVPATRVNLAQLEKDQAAIEEEAAKTIDQAKANADKLNGKTIRLTGKTVPGQTKLFGSITTADIADAVKNELGVTIERHQVALLHPIRRLGVYEILIDLHRNVDAHVRLEVADERGWLGLPETVDQVSETPKEQPEEGTGASDGESPEV